MLGDCSDCQHHKGILTNKGTQWISSYIKRKYISLIIEKWGFFKFFYNIQLICSMILAKGGAFKGKYNLQDKAINEVLSRDQKIKMINTI